jgi:hypothetical protein
MKPAYQLRNDATFIAQVQKATRNTDNFGIEPTHGLFGSQEWWEQIASGKLAMHTLCGVIIERFWGSMGDWPEIKVENDTGEISHWTRKVNTKDQDALYIPGQRIEIDYVLQRHRPKSSDHGAEVKQVIEVGCAAWRWYLAGFPFLWHCSERIYTYRLDTVQREETLCLTT